MKNLKVFLTLMMCVLVLPTSIFGSQHFTGNGGAGRSIAILLPQAVGLTQEQSILPIVVQGELVSNFSTYSAIRVLDRENLYKQYKELESGIYADNAVEAISNIGNLPTTELIMMGRITKTGTNYNLQLNVTQTSDKMTIASYSQSVTIDELNNLTAVRRASMALLERIGVVPTAQTRTALSGAVENNRVDAQFANARGIVAQRQGTEVAALSYFFQAAALDNSLLEAQNQSSVMAVNISSGNIGQNARNSIAWRRDWVARLTEAEKFFNSVFNENSIPYTLFYSTEIIAGAINYQTETQHLSINTNLRASGGHSWLASVEKALQAVYDGLDATGMRHEWGLQNWPWTSVSGVRPFGRKNANFNIIAELLNEKDRVIGRTNFQASGEWGFNERGRPQIRIFKDEDRNQVRFANVKVDDISDKMTIRIASVNGMSAETAARNGVLQVWAMFNAEWSNSAPFKIKNGEITEYIGRGGNVVIPSIVWNEPVRAVRAGIFRYKGVNSLALTIHHSITFIEKEAFANLGLTNVVISNGVNIIGANAFANNRLTSVSIPNSVTFIGNNAFAGNQLTSINIPNSVQTIGDKAFAGNKITSITIGSNVILNHNSFERRFLDRYEPARRAGTYTFNQGYAVYDREIASGGRYGDINHVWRISRETMSAKDAKEEKKEVNRRGIGALFTVIGLLGGLILIANLSSNN